MAVVDAARQAVIAIKQALLQKKGVLTTAATSDCSSSGDASAVDSAETATLQGEQSAAEPTTDQEELEAALDRDQVKELLAPFANDLDTSLASASQAALSAWQEASRKKIIIGRGTRQAEASSARGALQRSVRRVALEGSVARNFRGGASNNLD